MQNNFIIMELKIGDVLASKAERLLVEGPLYHYSYEIVKKEKYKRLKCKM